MSTNALTKRTTMFPSFASDFFNPWNNWFDNGFEKTLSIPAVNIAETDTQYNVSIAVPGMKKDDFKIHVDGDMLTISAEKEENKEENDKQYNRREYSHNSFTRSFRLPDNAKDDSINAHYEDGVLVLTIPKSKKQVKATKEIKIS